MRGFPISILVGFAVFALPASAQDTLIAPEDQPAVAAKVMQDSDCLGITTRDYKKCFGRRLDASLEIHRRYLDAAKANQSGDQETLDDMEKSEAAFTAYMEAECTAVWSSYRNGTIRNAEYLRCANRLLKRRTYTVWQNWLSYYGGTEPDLPPPPSQ